MSSEKEELKTISNLDEIVVGGIFEGCEIILDTDEEKREMTTLYADAEMAEKRIRVFRYEVIHRNGRFSGVKCESHKDITPEDSDWKRLTEFYNKFSGGIKI